MATSGSEAEDMRREQEADLPSGQTPEDVPNHREAGSDKEDAVLFARHKGKIFKAIFIPPSMSDFLKDKTWRWSEVGDADETVWDQLRNYIPSASGKTRETPQPVPSPSEPGGLEDTHVLELSKRITNEQELKELGIRALALPKYITQAAMYNHRTCIQDAAHNVLSTWLKDQPSRRDAYRNLKTGLKSNQMNQLASELQSWVEGVSAESRNHGEKIADLQSRLKDSLERNFKDFLKHDWLEEGLNFPLMLYYTDLLWTCMVKEAMGRQPKSMKGMDEILKVPGAGEKCCKILVEAGSGMGKSSSMAYLAMKWVKDKKGKFPFDFVFLIPLRNVDKNSSLAELVADEHDLEKEDIEIVKSILTDHKHKVLLLFDGYDEYTPGTNRELDRALEKTVGKCFLILTSRPKEGKDFTGKVRGKMDGELVIRGFSEENIRKCCSKYLGSEQEADKFLKEAKTKADLYELLKVPVILLMTSVLYNEDEKKSLAEDDKKGLPERKTELYENLYEFLMDRSTLKSNNFGCYSSEIPNLQDMLQTLGKFAWEALQRDVKQLLINKDDLEKECPDIMKLGLLHVVGVRKATAKKQPAFLSYEHKSLQEFGASKFVTKRLEIAENMKETLKELFPSWKAVQRYREVVLFVAGLMKDSRPLVQYLYEMQVEDYLNRMRTAGGPLIDADLFKSLQPESSVRLFDHPLHNKYINYYGHHSDTTSVYYPSRLYHFKEMRHEVVLEDHWTQAEEIPPCAMYIIYPDEAVSDSLLSICSQISTHQHVTDLVMVGVTCNSLEAPRLIKPRTVYLSLCELQDVFIKILLRQLIECHCGETLQRLELCDMNLRPFESLLDELLEDLVAHHEVGLAQRELRLWIKGLIIRTNLSVRFVEKWRNRCAKVDSIYCGIK